MAVGLLLGGVTHSVYISPLLLRTTVSGRSKTTWDSVTRPERALVAASSCTIVALGVVATQGARLARTS